MAKGGSRGKGPRKGQEHTNNSHNEERGGGSDRPQQQGKPANKGHRNRKQQRQVRRLCYL